MGNLRHTDPYLPSCISAGIRQSGLDHMCLGLHGRSCLRGSLLSHIGYDHNVQRRSAMRSYHPCLDPASLCDDGCSRFVHYIHYRRNDKKSGCIPDRGTGRPDGDSYDPEKGKRTDTHRCGPWEQRLTEGRAICYLNNRSFEGGLLKPTFSLSSDSRIEADIGRISMTGPPRIPAAWHGERR